jgi:hypothetical protein
MSSITLSKTETRLLTEAAGREDGGLILPRTMKATTAERLLGKLTKEGLITPREQNGAVEHHLTPTGYQAIGLKAPRRPRATAGASSQASADKPGTKRALILDLLGRGEGASLEELIAATGWLPHTTRAALSRIRSSGQALMKSTRPDGRTAYRIEADEPEPEAKPARKRAARRSPDPVGAAA